jgi:hypothetical protein
MPRLFLPRCGRMKEGESAVVYIKLDDGFLAPDPLQRAHARMKSASYLDRRDAEFAELE